MKKIRLCLIGFLLLFMGSMTVYAAEREWYENRYIYEDLVVLLDNVEGQWYFDASELDLIVGMSETIEIAHPTKDNWFLLDSFTELTGLTYLRRMDHIFVRSPQGGFLPTTQSEYTVLPFYFEDMDARTGYTLHPLDAEEMMIRAINYHRFNNQLPSYNRLQSLSIGAIYHSLDMRNNNVFRQTGANDESHQERMELWVVGTQRDYVRSSHVSHHNLRRGDFNQNVANQLVDIIMDSRSGPWLMNAYYHNIGVGIGIQEDNRMRVTIHMATARSENAIAYHVEHRVEREDMYARHREYWNAWFEENMAGQENPYAVYR